MQSKHALNLLIPHAPFVLAGHFGVSVWHLELREQLYEFAVFAKQAVALSNREIKLRATLGRELADQQKRIFVLARGIF